MIGRTLIKNAIYVIGMPRALWCGYCADGLWLCCIYDGGDNQPDFYHVDSEGNLYECGCDYRLNRYLPLTD